MTRNILLASALAVAGCALDQEPQVDPSESGLSTTIQDLSIVNATREQVAGDVYHYTYVLRVGDTANAQIAIHRIVRERAPWRARPTRDAVMFTHGDFASFATNFVPSADGLAPWLAGRNIDVWGFDRRWAVVPRDAGDLSDFDGMSLEQSLDDLGRALAFARLTRLIGEGSLEQVTLGGFSRGGQLAYFYASREATKPHAVRHVKAIVPIDVYVSLAPEHESERQMFCDFASFEYGDLANGVTDSPNGFQIATGELARDAPNDPSPFEFFPGFTNREVLLFFLGNTAVFFAPQPTYHLAAPVLDDGGNAIGLREMTEASAIDWLIHAPFHQSLREAADTDALTCGNQPLPLDLSLSRITVPVLLLAAAGGYGDYAIHSTTQVSSRDVTTNIVRQLTPERVGEDYGHGDLLYAASARDLAWRPLVTWLRAH